VREFDFKDLAKECFGTPAGDKKKKSNATSNYGFDIEWERHANAYVLLYEKVNKTTEDSTPTNVPAPKKSEDPSGLPLVDNQEVNEELDAQNMEPSALQKKQSVTFINNMHGDAYEMIQR